MKKLRLLCLFASAFFMTACESAASGESSAMCTVKFDTNTPNSLNASAVSTQVVKNGSRIKTPATSIVGNNPDSYAVFGWYEDKDLTDQWNFKKDTVSKDMTLYARWEKKFTVNYYTTDSKFPVNTVQVFEGNTVKEHPEYCVGFEYEGSFMDSDYTRPFTYDTPITSNVDIYMKKSEYIDMYEGNPTGGLFDNLEINGPTDNSGEVGNLSKVVDEFGEEAVLVDFGYSPILADPFIELSLNLDITKSPILHFVMKHYGKGTNFSIYYTTMLEDYTYSITSKSYGANFYAAYMFKPEEIEMTEEDEYIDVAIDLAKESMYHGYSVWGTSTYLGKLRIQASWKSTSVTDRSNKMLLKRIYGSNEGYEDGIVTTDTPEISAILKDDTSLPTQEDLPNGFVFPKDNKYVTPGETSEIYAKQNGLLAHFENEIEMRKHTDKEQTIKLELPRNDIGDVIGDKIISLDTYKTIYIKLRNYGYVENLKVAIRNDWEGSTYTTLKLPARMSDSKLFSVNLTSESSMRKNLASIEISYTASGVDNALLIESIYFQEAKPYDIPGISFDDKYVFGLNGTNVDVAYSTSYRSTEFNVKNSGATVTSNKTDISMTTSGYYFLKLTYTRSNNSNVNQVAVSFSSGSSYSSEFTFNLEGREKSSSVTIPLTYWGSVKNIKLKFVGTGIVRISELEFLVDDKYCLDLSKDINGSFDSTWLSGMNYAYEEMTSSASLEVDGNVDAGTRRMSLYLSVGHTRPQGAYNCANLSCVGKTKVTIVYRNTGDLVFSNIALGFIHTVDGNPDIGGNHYQFNSIMFQGGMKDYEWNSVEITIPAEMAQRYLGKITFLGLTNTIQVRNIAVI